MPSTARTSHVRVTPGPQRRVRHEDLDEGGAAVGALDRLEEQRARVALDLLGAGRHLDPRILRVAEPGVVGPPDGGAQVVGGADQARRHLLPSIQPDRRV